MGVVMQKRTLVLVVALVLVGLLASQVAATLQPAAAQSPDCFEEIYENRTTVVNGQTRTVRVVVGERRRGGSRQQVYDCAVSGPQPLPVNGEGGIGWSVTVHNGSVVMRNGAEGEIARATTLACSPV